VKTHERVGSTDRRQASPGHWSHQTTLAVQRAAQRYNHESISIGIGLRMPRCVNTRQSPG
jgi:hypothetical protein